MTKIRLSLSLTMALMYISMIAQVKQVTENQVGISERLNHEINMTKDPRLGFVPKSRLVNAYALRNELIVRKADSRTALSWTERGPYSDVVGPSNGNTRPGNGKTAGRSRAIWEDLSDPTGKTVWVGGIDGGLWKTTDITLNPANWVPINDFFGNLAVASICQDPTNFSILYFGTGEKAINSDAVRGAGIWQSLDGGLTWAVMPGTANFYNVSKVICDASGNLYVGNNSLSGTVGLQRYNKATATWTPITPTGLDTRITDLELSSTGRLHISCGYYNTPAASSGYRYTDTPATVTPSTWTAPLTTFTTQYNVDLASNGNTLYALPSNSVWEVPTIYKSTNGGANWAPTTTTPAFTSGQSWYNMAVAVDPFNANNVIVGALDCYKTTNGGSTWTKISNWVGTTGQYVHADQQAMTWNTNNQVLIACDGGIHYSANGGTTITDRNVGLRIKQFYSVANHPTSTDYFLAGAQDNGNHQLNGPGLTTSVEVTGGDGAFVHIDQDQPQFQWGAYVYNQYRRSTNSGGAWTSVNFSSSTGRFINPTDYDDVNNIMYAAGSANTFVRWSNPQSGATFTSVSMTALGGGTVSNIKVSPYTSNTVFFAGQGNGVAAALIKATNANATPTFTSIIGAGMNLSSAYISCIELGTDEQNIVAVFSNYGVNNVWVTSNGGSTWTAIDGNLPDMPVRWALFYPGDNTKMIIATETGVWQTDLINGASTIWAPESSFPNVRTDMLQYRSGDGLVSAATHGRGLFTAGLGTPPTCGAVSGLTASSITETSANVSWTAVSGALNYTVEYKLASTSTWTVLASATTSTSQAITGLVAGTLYDYRIKANCAGASSGYASAQFTTAASTTCGAVTGLAASAITQTSATVSWTALSGALSYTVEYKLSTSSTWTTAASATTATSQSITGLTAGTLYDYRVLANCASGSGAYASAQFTTASAITCPGVYDVSTNGTRTGAATIPFNTDILGLVNPSGDNDYYKFVITTSGTITLTLTTLPANYHLRLVNNAGTTLNTSANGGTTNEIINATVTPGTYYARVYPSNSSNWNATNCYTLRVALGTATGQSLDNGFVEVEPIVKVYPNPVANLLTVYLVSDNTPKTLTMYDVKGQEVYKQMVIDMFTTLDVQELNTGIYFLIIRDETGKALHTEKIAKE